MAGVFITLNAILFIAILLFKNHFQHIQISRWMRCVAAHRTLDAVSNDIDAHQGLHNRHAYSWSSLLECHHVLKIACIWTLFCHPCVYFRNIQHACPNRRHAQTTAVHIKARAEQPGYGWPEQRDSSAIRFNLAWGRRTNPHPPWRLCRISCRRFRRIDRWRQRTPAPLSWRGLRQPAWNGSRVSQHNWKPGAPLERPGRRQRRTASPTGFCPTQAVAYPLGGLSPLMKH